MPCVGSPWKSEPPVISSPRLGCHAVIALDGRRVVIRVVDLECIETGDRQRVDSGVDARAPGMRKRRDSAGAMDDADDHFRRRSGTGDERRAVIAQKSIEGVLACQRRDRRAAALARPAAGRSSGRRCAPLHRVAPTDRWARRARPAARRSRARASRASRAARAGTRSAVAQRDSGSSRGRGCRDRPRRP